MPGDTTPSADAKALWDEVSNEREAGEQLPSTNQEPEPKAQDASDDSVVEAADKTEAVAEVEADPYEGLSPALKARLQKLESYEQQVQQIPQLIQHVKTADGRVAAMQRELDVSKNAAKAASTGPSAAQIAAASGSLEKWDSLKTDFPEWADATEQFVKASLAGFSPQQTQGLDPQQVEEMVEQRMQQVRAETQRTVEEAKVEGKHPTWREEIQTDGFVAWFAKQQPEVQALARSPVGRDAIRMLDLYEEAKAKPASAVRSERQAKLAAAVSTKPGSSNSAGKTVAEMSPEELWNYEAKLANKRGQGLNY